MCVEVADARQVLAHLRPLGGQRDLVVHVLEAAAAAPRDVGTRDRHAPGTGREHLHQVRLGEAPARLGDARAHPVSGRGVAAEDDVAVVARDAGAAEGQVAHLELEDVVAAGAVHRPSMSVVAVIAPDLDAYRAGVERFLDASGGIADPSAADLFCAPAVEGLEAVAAAGASLRMRALARFAAEGYIRRASADESAEIEEVIRLPLVGSGEGAVALLDVDALLADEPDRERRRELQRARLRAIDAHLARPIADARLRRADAARALAADTPAALLARVSGIHLSIVGADGLRLLDASDDAAARALDRAAREGLGVGLGQTDAADLPRLVRAPQLRDALPAGGMAAAVARTCELLGLARAPSGEATFAGLAGYAQALRDAGIALAHAGASPRLPVEARRLGDPALRRAHGFLLEGLLCEPAWLARVLDAPDDDTIARTARAVRLLGIRAAAARAAALGGDGGDLLARATCVGWPDELRLADDLAGLRAADDLRARALASVLRAHLRETFGERWFAQAAAGGFLRELWLEAGDVDPEALAVELGAPGLDPGAVMAEALEGLD